MRHLLDAHTLIWALDDPSRLGAGAKAILENPATELTVSIGTIWELSIKTSLKKLSLSLPYRQWVERALADLGITVSPITLEFTERQTALPFHHRDPFDRLLVAQCLIETIPIVSADAMFVIRRAKTGHSSAPKTGHRVGGIRWKNRLIRSCWQGA